MGWDVESVNRVMWSALAREQISSSAYPPLGANPTRTAWVVYVRQYWLKQRARSEGRLQVASYLPRQMIGSRFHLW